MVAVVVLGCRVAPRSSRLEGARSAMALDRRAHAAAAAFDEHGAAYVVASGGRTWSGEMEADVIAEKLVQLGVPRAVIVRERCSHTTRENAMFSSRLIARRGASRVLVVTCAWHLPRALALFAKEGVRAEGYAAQDRSPAGLVTATYRRGREWVASRLDGVRT